MIKNNISISHTSYNIIIKTISKLDLEKQKELNMKDLIKSCDIGLSALIFKKINIKK